MNVKHIIGALFILAGAGLALGSIALTSPMFPGQINRVAIVLAASVACFAIAYLLRRDVKKNSNGGDADG